MEHSATKTTHLEYIGTIFLFDLFERPTGMPFKRIRFRKH